jgi:hypothetical protein
MFVVGHFDFFDGTQWLTNSYATERIHTKTATTLKSSGTVPIKKTTAIK